MSHEPAKYSMETTPLKSTENGQPGSLRSGDLLADLKRTLDAAVREYDTALMRKPTNEEEIRRAVDKCVYARERFNAALANKTDMPFRLK
jgi:hypothetical protein